MSVIRNALIICWFPVIALAQSGGDYNLTWNTVDCGGDTSVGGDYSLTGTIGQHDPGLATGGDYKLGGGFWGHGTTTGGGDTPPPPIGDPSDAESGKNRYLSFSVQPPATASASLEFIRVTLVDLTHPGRCDGGTEDSRNCVVGNDESACVLGGGECRRDFPFSAFNGEKRWVGTPGEFPDEDSSDPSQTFVAAQLQCDMPEAVDWSLFDLINVFGAEIVPGSTYHVQRADAGCPTSLDDDACFSDPLVVTTGKWGDVVESFFFEGGPAQPDFQDIAALVDKFQALPTAQPKTRAQLQPNVARPSFAIDFDDIATSVDSFTEADYPFAGPASCP